MSDPPLDTSQLDPTVDWSCVFCLLSCICSAISNLSGLVLFFLLPSRLLLIPIPIVEAKPDVTFFYLSARIFPKGYAKANKDKTRYHPPSLVLIGNPEIDIKACLEWEDLASPLHHEHFYHIYLK